MDTRDTNSSFTQKSIDLMEQKLSQNTGYGKEGLNILNEIIEKAHSNVADIMSELRHMLYKLGIRGSFEEIMTKAKDETNEYINTEKIEDSVETSEYYRIVKAFRTLMAIETFAEMSEETREKNLEVIKAKYFEPNSNILYEKYLDKDNKLKKIINSDTPIFDLLSIVQACEEKEDDKKMQRIKRDAAEFLVRKLITKHPHLIEKSAKFLKTRYYQAILRQMPDTLSDGEIGGKAGGVILGYAILQTENAEFDSKFAREHGMSVDQLANELNLENVFQENNSTFLGSDIFRQFIAHNENLAKTAQLKGYYDSENNESEDLNDLKSLHADIDLSFESADFPAHLKRQLRALFKKIHATKKPIIIRSSSELEDMKGAAFAGKYVSVNLANQGELTEDFDKFIDAIKTVYKSVFSPEVMEYRSKKGLIRYDEEMGVLIQDINGQKYGKYFLPNFSAVGMSYATQSFGGNPEKGAASLAAGLGDQVVDDTGRFIMFDKPKANGVVDNYVQSKIVVMNLETNSKEILSSSRFIRETNSDSRFLAYATSRDKILNLDNLVKVSKMPLVLEYIVQKLKYCLGYDVDCEFTIDYKGAGQFEVKLVQQRPQNIPKNLTPSAMPDNISEENVLIENSGSVTSGLATNISYAIYIDPNIISSPDFIKHGGVGYKIQEWVEKINRKMDDKDYLIFTPQRWGSDHPGPWGIPVRFNHFSNAAGFIEMFHGDYQPSFGTHFFQDVMDSEMISGSIDTYSAEKINNTFFEDSKNMMKDYLDEEIPDDILKYMKLIDIKEEVLDPKGREMKLHVAANNVQINGNAPALQVYLAPKDKNMPIPLKKKIHD